MSGIQIFSNPEFGSIRTLDDNGKTLFCAPDVAKALGYANPRKAIADHCPHVTKRYIGVQTGTKADGTPALQNVEMSFIPEGDVYRLITHSKLPGAEKFESWVFDDVLPTIHKHGAYMTPETLQNAILNPDTMIQLCQQLKAEQNKNKTLTVTQVALNFGMTANKLNKLLDEWGIQRKVNKQWIPKRKYIDKGYTLSIPVEVGNGETKENTRWTRAGQAFLYKQLHDHGYKTVKEQQEEKAKERKVLPAPAEQPA